MWKEGRISCAEFNSFLEDFLQRSKALGDSWEARLGPKYLQLDPSQPVKYLVKNHFREITAYDNTDVVVCEPDIKLDELSIIQEDEGEVVCHSNNKCFAKYEYHLIYSPSYGVPVLYFTAYTQDGCPLRLEDIWSAVPVVYQQRLQAEKWTFLTQQEHPFLGKPFFQLHPCHTADMMKSTCASEQQSTNRRLNYLVIWLSSVGPVIGLHLPLQYATQDAT